MVRPVSSCLVNLPAHVVMDGEFYSLKGLLTKPYVCVRDPFAVNGACLYFVSSVS